MKLSNWSILMASIATVFIIMFFYEVGLTEKMEEENERIKQFCISSCQSALQDADIEDEEVFGSEKTREKVINTFQKVYSDCCNYITEEQQEAIKYQVPCIIMCDWDGYYVWNTQWIKDHGYTEYKDIITEKNFFSEKYGDYVVKYQIRDNVKVSLYKDGKEKVFEGYYKDVYDSVQKYIKTEPDDIGFMSDYETFNDERNKIIVECIRDTAEYYINTHNEYYNLLSTQYTITLPTSNNDIKASLLDSPCVIAFAQGKQIKATKSQTNIYTFVAADLSETEQFVVSKDGDGELLYHKKECEDITTIIFEGNMKKCAEFGANPASCVINP